MRLIAALVMVLAVACDKGEGAAALAAGGPAAREALLDAWKQGGLEPSAMTPATITAGKDCQSGTVGGVDVVVCVYATPAEAKAAETAGLDWVGPATGMSQASGAVLIAAADRRKSDPNGRTINKLSKLAPR